MFEKKSFNLYSKILRWLASTASIAAWRTLLIISNDLRNMMRAL